jgi:hypothetical protein
MPTIKKSDVKKITILSLAVIVLILPVFWCGRVTWQFYILSQTPKDEVLLNNFYAHRTDFDQIIQMLEEEQDLRFIDPDNGSCQWGSQIVDQSQNLRCKEYIRLSKKIGLIGTIPGPRGFHMLPVWYDKTAMLDAREKGYVYQVEQRSCRLVTSTDVEGNHCLNRHIEGKWYIFFEPDM